MGDIPPEFQKDSAPRKTNQGTSRLFGSRRAPQSPNEALQPETVPQPPSVPPSRRRPALSAFSGILSFLLIAAFGAMLGLVWSQHRMREPGPLAADKVLYIAPGAELPDIISELEQQGVIDSPFALNVALLVEGNRSKVKAGEYLFKQNASLQEVMDTLVSGKQLLHAVTIPEGLTSQQIVERLLESDFLVGDLKDAPKEGSLLPETYKVARGTARADLIKKMQDDQKRIVDQIWSRRVSDLPLHSPHELVTLASIVEKETGKADERSRVASVFLNRLVKRMRLQSDPTIVYGLVGGKGTLGHGISRSELEKPTPYNTYTIDGLPPGPIANPGRAALEAVANPSRTHDLYFVADGSGGHVFSENLDQHNRNVQRWRQIDKEAKERLDKSAPEPDKLSPEAAPLAAPPAPAAPSAPSRGDKRGELETEPTVYGSLGDSFEAQLLSQDGAPAPNDPQAFAAIDKAAPSPATPAKKGSTRKVDSGRQPAAFSAFTMGPGLDDLGISVRGVMASPAETLDGPVSASEPQDARVETATFPISPARRAEQKAHAARFGLSPGADELPPEPAAAPAPQNAGTPGRARVVDVSEGTPLDPLRNKTYDLNYPKTVPAMK
ncbi:endolytic transglycosylase MltG [Methylocapsa palsarum]|uniref:Endolytic murein transglycosylase n=1 Tax=Methylocapsa palsarum TaxID=1612308 RepID=A0A1I3WQN0_9HYPH|nr:endolytic transglycosylase MltG [Methylocapsa palsarum]SFK09974.1 UPF0755 protein [Methylocapsa palsarum]